MTPDKLIVKFSWKRRKMSEKKMSERNDEKLRPRQSIEDDTAFFKRLIDTVPAMQYFDHDTKEKLKEKRNKHMDKKVQEIEKGLKTNVDWSGKAKLKRARFDPTENQTVSQLQERLENETVTEDEPSSKKQKKKKKKIRAVAEENNDDDEEVDELKSSTSNMEELRRKLQEKITILAGKRKNHSTYNRQERQKLKRIESKMKRKLKLKTQKNNDNKSLENTSSGGPQPKQAKPAKPVFNKEGKMVFSKFDFTGVGEPDKKAKKEKSKDFKQLLKKAEKQKEQVENLESVDKEKAKKLIEKQKWEKALQKSEGIKVRDDPEMLKKALKRKEKKKQKMATGWEERSKKVDEKMKARQDKRKRNIKKKKDSTISRKINKAKKKGRVIPGF